MSGLLVIACLLLLLIERTWSYSYNGTQCEGVLIGVDLLWANASLIIDTSVTASMEVLFQKTPWASISCVSTLRQHFCMTSLQYGNTSLAQMPYCADSCLDLLEYPSVAQYTALVCEIYPDFQTFLYAPCYNPELPADTNCYTGSSSTHDEVEPVCPLPLVIPDHASLTDQGANVELITGTACAFPCQPIIYSDQSWTNMKFMFISFFCISFIASCLSCVDHYLQKKKMLFYLSLGTLTCSFWMTLFNALNYRDDSFLCAGNAGYYTYNPFCVFSGFMLLASVNWYATWLTFICLTLWLTATRKWNALKIKTYEKYFIAFAVFTSSLLFINLCAGNLGYEWDGGTSCICSNLYEQQPKFWHYLTTFSPVIIFAVILPSFFILDTLRHVAIAQDRQSTKKNYLAKIFRFVMVNYRLFKFVVIIICLSALYCMADLVATYYLNPTQTIEDGATCLLANASPDPNHGLDVCGNIQINDIWTIYIMVFYGAFFSTTPLLVFGCSAVTKRVADFFASFIPWSSRENDLSAPVIYGDVNSGEIRMSNVTKTESEENPINPIILGANNGETDRYQY